MKSHSWSNKDMMNIACWGGLVGLIVGINLMLIVGC
jgi:hypothetical protein